MEKNRDEYIDQVIKKLNDSLKGIGYEAININRESLIELPSTGSLSEIRLMSDITMRKYNEMDKC